MTTDRKSFGWICGLGVATACSLWVLARTGQAAAFVVVAGIALLATARLVHRALNRSQETVSDASAVTLDRGKELREATESLRRSEQKFRGIFETMADGYFRTRLSDGHIFDVNPATVKILGYPSIEAVMEQRTMDIYSDLSDRTALVDAIRTHGEFNGLELKMRCYDGSDVVVLMNGRLVPGLAGQSDEVEANFFDMSTQKATEAALEEARRQAEAANRGKSVFLANMSHELRTPMNAIIGYSEILLEDAEEDGNESAADDLGKIHAASKHLLGLINDVLDLSKVEAGKMEIHLETFEIGEVLDDVASTIAPAMEKNGNDLSVEIDPGVTRMHTDVTKLRQALLNLLSNAAKFTHEGEICLTVELQCLEGADWIHIAVADSGIGIPPEKLEHVFEEFAQADESTTRHYGGTGLGLPISRRFCRMMGGDVTLESRLGEGSTFSILLPVGLEEIGGAPMSASISSVPTSQDAPVVLVIDDDPNALDLLGRTFQGAGLRVVTASDGGEALRLARTLKPGAITLDVKMPVMDGWEVLQALKADPETQRIPVIMVTMTDDRQRGYAVGATDFLTKPVDRERLVEILLRCTNAESESVALVVDDESEARAVLRRALEQADWTVVEAENGAMALERIATVQPSLILLDLLMPVIDGFEFLRQLRTHAAWSEIPVVVVTAKDLTAEERQRLNGDIAGLVQKAGLDRDTLLAQIRDQVAAALATPLAP